MAKRIKGSVVRLGIIGCGSISRGHARGILEHADKVTCVALCDISRKNLRDRDEQLGGGLALFADWRKMLRECGDGMDAVLIALPHDLHASAIRDAARAGKHILCEKPLCTSLREATAITKAVKQARVTYMSAHNQLFMPVVQEAKRLIDDGAIGRVRYISSADCFLAGKTAFRGKWRANAKRQGGGELIDTGYHPTYRLLHLAGAPAVAVRASMARFEHAIEGEDTACVQVCFANGVLGEILTSWAFALPYGKYHIHVIGEKGQVFGSGNELYYLPEGFAQPAKRTLPAVQTFDAQMGCFADCLLQGKRPPHGVEEGRAVLDIILKAAKSAAGWDA